MTMIETAADGMARRGFHIGLPSGFVSLPVAGDDLKSTKQIESFVASVAAKFGMSAMDENAVFAAASFADLGVMAGDGGVDYAALAFYKSPDDPLRPIMVLLAGIALQSQHRSRSEAITGLLEAHSASGASSVERIELPVGPAVAVVSEEQKSMIADGIQFPAVTRQLSAWIPDRDGTTIGVLSVLTNSFQDWERVCVLALDVFDSFGWEPLGG